MTATATHHTQRQQGVGGGSITTPTTTHPHAPPPTNLKCLLQSAEIKCGDQFKFIILMMPTDTSISFFIQELNKHSCKSVVRVCESKYSLEPFKQNNIQVIDLPYQDGTAPSAEVINDWIEFLQSKRAAADLERADKTKKSSFSYSNGTSNTTNGTAPTAVIKTKNHQQNNSSGSNSDPVCVAIHCVAGLGRAPVLVAVALMEYGMKSLEVVELIRSKRRGAINQTQLDFLTNYKSKKRLKPKRNTLTSCFFAQ